MDARSKRDLSCHVTRFFMSSPTIIKAGDHVLIRLANGNVKSVHLEQDS